MVRQDDRIPPKALACGEDPNYGLYSSNVRRAVRSIVAGQDGNTGYFGSSMYDHGFALLGLLWLLADVLLPFVIGMAIAYVLDPVVVWLTRRHVSRATAAGLLVGGSFVVGVVAMVVVGPVVSLSGSIGIATAEDGRDRYTDLVRRADTAMYSAKRAGRNRVIAFRSAPTAESSTANVM